MDSEPLHNLLEGAWRWPSLLLGLLLGILLLTLVHFAWRALSRLQRRVRDGHGRWRHPLLRGTPILTLLLLLSTVLLLGYLLFELNPLLFSLALFATGLSLSIAAIPLLRDLLAGFVLVLRRPFAVGEHLRVLGFEGELLRIGLRACALRTANGNTIEVPNSSITQQAVVSLGNAHGAHPISVELQLPADTDTAWIKRLGLRAAVISPFAAPSSKAEVLFRAKRSDELCLEIRSAAISPLYEEALRSDILEIVREAMLKARSAQQAKAEGGSRRNA
ncbi:MAG: mechanosensitive ion channel [Myxococcota bacterium]|jgi:small-conductance mechanosensitive channel|nr:mechanosensitive ion channel [Myxococcota bacterium]